MGRVRSDSSTESPQTLERLFPGVAVRVEACSISPSPKRGSSGLGSSSRDEGLSTFGKVALPWGWRRCSRGFSHLAVVQPSNGPPGASWRRVGSRSSADLRSFPGFLGLAATFHRRVPTSFKALGCSTALFLPTRFDPSRGGGKRGRSPRSFARSALSLGY